MKKKDLSTIYFALQAAENQAKLLGQKDRAKKFNKAGKKLWNDTVK